LKTVLFVCVENAGRSQMAEAFARHYGKRKVAAESAGTMPAKNVNPMVLQAMKEKGIDLSENHPKIMDLKRAEKADIIITMGCSVEEYCPAPMLKKAVDWGLPDPKGKSIEEIRKIRNEIEKKVLQLLGDL